jgi:hypothetical protein
MLKCGYIPHLCMLDSLNKTDLNQYSLIYTLFNASNHYYL